MFDYYNNKVYADGTEITARYVIATISLYFEVAAFCVPEKTRLIAVTNELQLPEAYVLGSIRNKLVTNKRKWRCVESTMDEEDWFKVKYDDRNWPQAYEKSLATVNPTLLYPNISRNATPISGPQMRSPKYYCRAWIGDRPTVEEILTRTYKTFRKIAMLCEWNLRKNYAWYIFKMSRSPHPDIRLFPTTHPFLYITIHWTRGGVDPDSYVAFLYKMHEIVRRKRNCIDQLIEERFGRKKKIKNILR